MELVKKLRINNSLGLHARAAAKVVELGKQYQSKLVLKKEDQEVDGSNILAILTLSCPKESEIQATVIGEDSQDFMAALENLFDKRFGENK